jgi:hypothetical protein
MTSMFTKGFQTYACEGDSISCTVEGFTLHATLYRDDCGDRPDERDCGFWPSLDTTAINPHLRISRHV